MNFLKLLRCYWKHPIGKDQFKAVAYYIQYERVNHITNPIYEDYGRYKILAKHEDEIDRLIFENLYDKLSKIPGITELHVYTDELIVDGEFEERYRAIFSRSAHGHPYKDLVINYNNGRSQILKTRVLFLKATVEEAVYEIVPHIPLAIDLNIPGPVDSIIKADFLDKEYVDQILRLHDYDFSSAE